MRPPLHVHVPYEKKLENPFGIWVTDQVYSIFFITLQKLK